MEKAEYSEKLVKWLEFEKKINMLKVETGELKEKQDEVLLEAAKETVPEGYIAYKTMADTNYQKDTVLLIFAVKKDVEPEDLNLTKNDDGTIDCTYGRFDWMNDGHGDPEENMEDIYIFEYEVSAESWGEWAKARIFSPREKVEYSEKFQKYLELKEKLKTLNSGIEDIEEEKEEVLFAAAQETCPEGYVSASTMADTNYQEDTVPVIFAVLKGLDSERVVMCLNQDGSIICTYDQSLPNSPRQDITDVYLFGYREADKNKGKWYRAKIFKIMG